MYRYNIHTCARAARLAIAQRRTARGAGRAGPRDDESVFLAAPAAGRSRGAWCTGFLLQVAQRTAHKSAMPAGRHEIDALLQRTDTFIFDCDGVLYTPEGTIPQVPAALAALRRAGKRVLFLTNGGSSTREELQASLTRKGYEADISEIFGAAYLTAVYLRSNAQLAAGDKVYVAGAPGMASEIRRHAGLEVLGGGDDNDRIGCSVEEVAMELLDPAVRVVVMGGDAAGFSYYKVSKCVRYLVENAGCQFVLANPDTRFPIASARAADPGREGSVHSYLPAAGAQAACVSACTGRSPVVVGKPSTLAMKLIMAEHGIDPARTAMIGDTLDTDIEFGNASGVSTVLVLTGNTSEEAGVAALQGKRPALIVSSAADLLYVRGAAL